MGQIDRESHLLASLTEDIKLSLLRLSALSSQEDDSRGIQQQIQAETQRALSLIDDSVLCSLLMCGQLKLQLEPVQLGSVLVDTINDLYSLAKSHNCKLEFTKQGSLKPAYTDRQFASVASRNLLRSLIEASSENRVIDVSAYTSGKNTVFSFADSSADLSKLEISKVITASRYSSQPLPLLTSGPASGMYISATVLAELGTRLRLTKKAGASRLAATFNTSTQLSLV